MEQILTEQTPNKHQICLPTTTTPYATSITLTLHLGRGLRPMPVNTKRLRSMQAWAKPFHIYCRMAHCQREYYLFDNSERLFSGIFQAFVRYLCFTHKTPSCFPLFYYIITARIVHAPILRRGKGRRLF